MRTLMLSLFLLLLFASLVAAEDLGTASYESSESTITVTGLVRRNNVVTLKGMYQTNGKFATFNSADAHGDSFLLDEEKGVKYFPLEDTNANKLYSGPLKLKENGDTGRFWVKFPAPPIEVKEISVYFSGYEPLDDLPITDK